jgi:hypothetical protein
VGREKLHFIVSNYHRFCNNFILKLENKYDLLYSLFFLFFYFPLLLSPSHSTFFFSFLFFSFFFLFSFSSFFFFFFFLGKCSTTRSPILASSLCIRLSTFVLCRSSPPWPLLLFAGCVFALNKNFLLFKSFLMADL